MISQLLAQFSELTYGFSTKADGSMSFLYGDHAEVVNNRRHFLDRLQIKPEDCVAIRLGHVDHFEVVTANDKGRAMLGYQEIPYSDAVITSQPGVGLFFMTADCTPALVYDPVKKVIAGIHMSWKTTDQELAPKVVAAMKREYGTNPADLVVYLGPGIKAESYLMKDPGQKDDPRWQPFLKQVGDQTAVDVVGFNKKLLTDAGIKPENIEESPINTAIDHSYFSHYRASRNGEPEGRFATVAIIKQS